MFKRSYAGVSTNGVNGSFGMLFESDLRPVVGLDPSEVTTVTSAVVSAPGADTISATTAGNFTAVAEIKFDAMAFTIGVDSGVIVLLPVMRANPILINGVGRPHNLGYTVGNIENAKDASYVINYPDDKTDHIDNTPLAALPNSNSDIDAAGVEVVTWDFAPDNLRRQLRTRTGTTNRGAFFLSVPAALGGQFNVFATDINFKSPSIGEIVNIGNVQVDTIFIPLVM